MNFLRASRLQDLTPLEKLATRLGQPSAANLLLLAYKNVMRSAQRIDEKDGVLVAQYYAGDAQDAHVSIAQEYLVYKKYLSESTNEVVLKWMKHKKIQPVKTASTQSVNLPIGLLWILASYMLTVQSEPPYRLYERFAFQLLEKANSLTVLLIQQARVYNQSYTSDASNVQVICDFAAYLIELHVLQPLDADDDELMPILQSNLGWSDVCDLISPIFNAAAETRAAEAFLANPTFLSGGANDATYAASHALHVAQRAKRVLPARRAADKFNRFALAILFLFLVLTFADATLCNVVRKTYQARKLGLQDVRTIQQLIGLEEDEPLKLALTKDLGKENDKELGRDLDILPQGAAVASQVSRTLASAKDELQDAPGFLAAQELLFQLGTDACSKLLGESQFDLKSGMCARTIPFANTIVTELVAPPYSAMDGAKVRQEFSKFSILKQIEQLGRLRKTLQTWSSPFVAREQCENVLQSPFEKDQCSKAADLGIIDDASFFALQSFLDFDVDVLLNLADVPRLDVLTSIQSQPSSALQTFGTTQQIDSALAKLESEANELLSLMQYDADEYGNTSLLTRLLTTVLNFGSKTGKASVYWKMVLEKYEFVFSQLSKEAQLILLQWGTRVNGRIDGYEHGTYKGLCVPFVASTQAQDAIDILRYANIGDTTIDPYQVTYVELCYIVVQMQQRMKREVTVCDIFPFADECKADRN